VDALLQCQDEGKIREFGVSNFGTSLIKDVKARSQPAAAEVQYSLLDRRPENSLLPYCRETGIPVLAYGVIAQGLLSGKYGPEHRFDLTDRRSRLPHFARESWPAIAPLLGRLLEISNRVGKSAVEVATRWVLDAPGVAAAIVGAKSPIQIEQTIGAIGWTLEASDRALLSEHRVTETQRSVAARI